MTKTNPTNKELVNFLKSKKIAVGFINKLKIEYRPYICPFNILLGFIERQKKIFDIGCGQGQLALLISQYTFPVKMKGIDISEESVENAKKLFTKHQFEHEISFDVYDGINLPKEIGDYDYITLIDVIHHIPKNSIYDFLGNLYNVMSSGSRLIIKDIDAASPLVIFNKLHDFLISGSIGNEISRKNLESMIGKTGFTILSEGRIRMLWYPHFWYVVEK